MGRTGIPSGRHGRRGGLKRATSVGINLSTLHFAAGERHRARLGDFCSRAGNETRARATFIYRRRRFITRAATRTRTRTRSAGVFSFAPGEIYHARRDKWIYILANVDGDGEFPSLTRSGIHYYRLCVQRNKRVDGRGRRDVARAPSPSVNYLRVKKDTGVHR